MKKFYAVLFLLPLVTLCVAQIGYDWWQMLPSDFQDNPYERQTVMAQKINDDIITSANSLEELWGTVGEDFIYTIDAQTPNTVDDFSTGDNVPIELPVQGADDYTGQYSILAGNDALYVLYNVTDDDVVISGSLGDNLELHFAPYAEKYDPGREIHPNTAITNVWGGFWWAEQLSHVWGWDANANDGAGAPFGWAPIITGENYVEMSKYGSWSEAGAFKVTLNLESGAEVFPEAVVYTMLGDDMDILGGVTNGALPSAMQSIYETKTGGFLYLAIIPWDIMPTGKMEEVGDQISIALKVNDFDNDNVQTTDDAGNAVINKHPYWGATDNNNAYWAIAFYGARVELALGPLDDNAPAQEVATAYYTNGELVIKNTDGNHTVNIFDVNGKLMGQFQGENNINMSFLSNGFYVASVSDKEGNKSVLKFVKSK